eukprot:6174441-Pleurochrysis_carterae.AAC.3
MRLCCGGKPLRQPRAQGGRLLPRAPGHGALSRRQRPIAHVPFRHTHLRDYRMAKAGHQRQRFLFILLCKAAVCANECQSDLYVLPLLKRSMASKNVSRLTAVWTTYSTFYTLDDATSLYASFIADNVTNRWNVEEESTVSNLLNVDISVEAPWRRTSQDERKVISKTFSKLRALASKSRAPPS